MANLAWGGFANGRISTAVLERVDNFNPIESEKRYLNTGSAFLKPAANKQLRVMQADFFKKFAKLLQISEALRDYDAQVARRNAYVAYTRGGPWAPLAAYAGTSNHGWACSVDIAVRFLSQTEIAWLHAEGPKYGWYPTVPTENWHFDYLGNPLITVASAIITPIKAQEGDMAARNRLIRNDTKGDKNFGSIVLVNTDTGLWWHLPTDGWRGELAAIGYITPEQAVAPENLTAARWGFIKDRCNELSTGRQ